MTTLTPEQQAAVCAAMLRYLNDHRDELLDALREDLHPSNMMWDAQVIGAGADVICPDDEADQDEIDEATEQAMALIRYSVTLTVAIGDERSSANGAQTVTLETGELS